MNLKKVLEMKAKREDTRLKLMAILNKADSESRFLTDEEKTEIDKFEAEIRRGMTALRAWKRPWR